ncbi:nuclear transport factor 2 family protein [Pseudoalteromonas luteoviolacea]|uniref:nuclear transport factor 2 family protein n=1 Tax=Pseudoalteromonas luteoviolacea TaxID=43657 RepID=UPI001F4135BE|nr:nuclear transport factor 2 family protein [Pseudoalteromonas luteoviolacea]MCF6442496.1 nuclear transport factor 2 family protein [Pseudoalteromonas luteoviolacea]
MKQLLTIPFVFLTACTITKPIEQSTYKLCEQTLYQYTEIRDKGTTEQYVSLFTENATFNVDKLNISLSGHQALASRFENARETKKSIHLMTSSRIFLDENSNLNANSNFILYLQNKNNDGDTTVIAGRYLDKLSVTESACKFSHREVIVDRIDTL